MSYIAKADLYRWCRIPATDLLMHPGLRVRFRIVRNSAEMGLLMARELVEVIEANNEQNLVTRAIVLCAPKCWYVASNDLKSSRTQASVFRKIISILCWLWRSARLAAHINLFRPCRSRWGSRNVSPPGKCAFTATPAPGSRPHCELHYSLNLRPNIR